MPGLPDRARSRPRRRAVFDVLVRHLEVPGCAVARRCGRRVRRGSRRRRAPRSSPSTPSTAPIAAERTGTAGGHARAPVPAAGRGSPAGRRRPRRHAAAMVDVRYDRCDSIASRPRRHGPPPTTAIDHHRQDRRRRSPPRATTQSTCSADVGVGAPGHPQREERRQCRAHRRRRRRLRRPRRRARRGRRHPDPLTARVQPSSRMRSRSSASAGDLTGHDVATATRPATTITAARDPQRERDDVDGVARTLRLDREALGDEQRRAEDAPGAGDHRGNVARAVLGPDPDAGAEHADATVVLVCERRGQHQEPTGRGRSPRSRGRRAMPTTRSLTVGAGARPTSPSRRRASPRSASGVNDSAVTKEPTVTCRRLARPSPMVISSHRARVGPPTGDQAVAVDPAAELRSSVAAPIPWKSGAEGSPGRTRGGPRPPPRRGAAAGAPPAERSAPPRARGRRNGSTPGTASRARCSTDGRRPWSRARTHRPRRRGPRGTRPGARDAGDPSLPPAANAPPTATFDRGVVPTARWADPPVRGW